MKISEIKDKPLRELAKRRAADFGGSDSWYLAVIGYDIDLKEAFTFSATPEDFDFWWDVYTGVRTSLVPTTPRDFILKEQNNVLLQDYTQQKVEWFMDKYAKHYHELRSKNKNSFVVKIKNLLRI